MRHDFAVFIGRFQPLHIGHQHVIDRALESSTHVIILIGSADSARSIRNPFTYQERVEFFDSVYGEAIASKRIILQGISDRAYNDDAWIAEVQRIVKEVVLDIGNKGGIRLHGTKDFSVALAGYKKDGTSYYLKKFPEWGAIDIPSQYGTFNSSDIRDDYFRRSPMLPHDTCSPGTVAFLKAFRLSPTFAGLVAEKEYLDDYRAAWSDSPYPPTFVTVDSVVVQSGHVLLVRRGDHPGKGLLAIPGGFLNQSETLVDAAVRELREETQISDRPARGKQFDTIPPAILTSFIDDKASRVFDDPNRSMRGRVITHAFLFRCPDRRVLYHVKGADDAASAAWHRFGDLRPDEFFEDHFSILEAMIGI